MHVHKDEPMMPHFFRMAPPNDPKAFESPTNVVDFVPPSGPEHTRGDEWDPSFSTLLSEESPPHKPQEEDDDEDEDNDHGSLSSDSSVDLFSDEESESSSSPSPSTVPLQRLRRTFAQRHKLLMKISQGKSPAYAQMLCENEKLVQDEAYRILSQQEAAQTTARGPEVRRLDETYECPDQAPDPKDTPQAATRTPGPGRGMTAATSSGLHQAPASTPPTFPAYPQNRPQSRLQRTIVSELNHTFPGYLNFILYCVAHTSICGVVSLVILEVTRNIESTVAIDVIHLVITALGLAISRFCGTIWIDYVNPETYECVKFDMHNRLRLGDLDARRVQWFQRHSNIRSVLDFLGFYLCLTGVIYFQFKVLKLFDMRDSLFKDLPSALRHDIVTPVKERLWYGSDEYDNYFDYLEELGDKDPLANFTILDMDFLWERLSSESYAALIGSEEYPAIDFVSEMVFYVVCAAIPILVMAKTNFTFSLH